MHRIKVAFCVILVSKNKIEKAYYTATTKVWAHIGQNRLRLKVSIGVARFFGIAKAGNYHLDKKNIKYYGRKENAK